jgi:hypothetical protein
MVATASTAPPLEIQQLLHEPKVLRDYVFFMQIKYNVVARVYRSRHVDVCVLRPAHQDLAEPLVGCSYNEGSSSARGSLGAVSVSASKVIAVTYVSQRENWHVCAQRSSSECKQVCAIGVKYLCVLDLEAANKCPLFEQARFGHCRGLLSLAYIGSGNTPL